MTPVTFAISGVIFAFTAATYAEATARFPEAGGSASFSRRAFNEAVSFFAAWAQMLNYTVTIAISAYTVPPYLSVFPGCGFMRNGLTGQVVVAAGLCIVLALLNIRGIQESARLNILLAIADLATQALLVVVGVALILNPQVLVGNVHFGDDADRLGVPDLDPDRHGRLHGHRDDLEHGRGGARPRARRAALDRPRGRGGVRDLRVPARGRALGDAGARDAGALRPAGHGGHPLTRRRSAPSTRATPCRASCRTSASGR